MTDALEFIEEGFSPEDLYIPEGSHLVKIKDCVVRDVCYMTAFKPKIVGLGGQSLVVVIDNDDLRLSWGVPMYEISYYASNLHEWHSIDVHHEYPLRTLIGSEVERSEHILNKTRGTIVHEDHGPRLTGASTGRGAMEAWGYYFNQYILAPGGRELIVAAMKKEFPDRAAKIEKNVDAYRYYYNLGRLPGCKIQKIKLDFVRIHTGDLLTDTLG